MKVNTSICIFLLLILFSFRNACGQITEDTTCEITIDTVLNKAYYKFADVMPIYRGGQDSLNSVIMRNIKWPGGHCDYSGTVYVAFIIEANGTVTHKRILRGFEDNDICKVKSEALRVIDFLIDWIPGQCKGINVPVQFVLPIKFKMKD